MRGQDLLGWWVPVGVAFMSLAAVVDSLRDHSLLKGLAGPEAYF
jgi:hypothetical protein